MATNINKIFSGYQPCQLVKTTDVSGTISVLIIGLLCIYLQVYMWGGLDTQVHHSPDDGDGAGPWNVGDFLTNWHGW
jgi:hypothetical protein